MVGICFILLLSTWVRQDQKPQGQSLESCHRHLLMMAVENGTTRPSTVGQTPSIFLFVRQIAASIGFQPQSLPLP